MADFSCKSPPCFPRRIELYRYFLLHTILCYVLDSSGKGDFENSEVDLYKLQTK